MKKQDTGETEKQVKTGKSIKDQYQSVFLSDPCPIFSRYSLVLKIKIGFKRLLPPNLTPAKISDASDIIIITYYRRITAYFHKTGI